MGKQCRPRSDCLIRVYTVCHSVCICSMVELYYSKFRIITANFQVPEYLEVLRYFIEFPAKNQISLGTRPVWSAVRLKKAWILLKRTAKTNQIGPMTRLICHM